MDTWHLIRRPLSLDGRKAVAFHRNAQGLIRFTEERWQRYYDPSPEDMTAPVEDGLWVGNPSGLYASMEDAEKDARAIIAWYGALTA